MKSPLASKLLGSLIQLVVGILLIGLAGWYLRDHPAERQSIESSFATIKQKTTDLFSRFGSKGGSALMEQQKKQTLSQLQEIIVTIQQCDPSTPISSYEDLYATLSGTSAQDLVRNGSLYYTQLSDAYQKMQQICNTGSEQ